MKNNFALISVIVPVYNVGEKLINRCIESIIGQTYKNLEIILVDDGSTDNSGEVCDQWKNKDSKIKVIHQVNGGLSAARNTGTKNATGVYIVYVDSDDWIEGRMIECMYNALIDTKSDMSICGITMTDEIKSDPFTWFENDCVLTRDEAYKKLIENKKITSHAWNKLYKQEIIKQVPFPEGKLYEDIRMMHEVFRRCMQVAVVKEHLYNYYRRPDSISALPKLHNKIEFSAAFADRYKYVNEFTPEYSDLVLSQIASSISLSLVQCSFYKEDIKQHRRELDEIKRFLNRKDVKQAIKNHYEKNIKIYYLMASIFSYHSNIIYRKFLRSFTKSSRKWN